jgi:hypothetical protein
MARECQSVKNRWHKHVKRRLTVGKIPPVAPVDMADPTGNEFARVAEEPADADPNDGPCFDQVQLIVNVVDL